ncbi:hypothetical protein C1752_12048 [Acaryochloris thomasi RCC1774]|uniref:Uncharacterized protein n=1 Tax=Acaryochloris thomasi RCC1774 TaxID=1764569 RepID=A0A2W1JNJ7_9CYAN|nr:hypothetical protein [Acaryochloris thomasi]PZD70477.1 hypothetical protein C1752_12048 [Acaryochloris thomasi RCC1774]
MAIVQLELNLWEQLAVAEENPEQTDVEQLCLGLDLMLTQVSERQQLATAGEAFLQIAEVFSRRADLLLGDWRQAHSEEGPVLDLDALEGLVRQSMSFDLDDLIAESEPVTRRTFPKDEVESRVAIVEKEVLLQELDLQEAEDVFSVVEEEDVKAWVDAISIALGSGSKRVSLSDLWVKLGLSAGRVWLALLLGGFRLEVEGDFYMTPQQQLNLSVGEV